MNIAARLQDRDARGRDEVSTEAATQPLKEPN
jgi:hypothetical protein